MESVLFGTGGQFFPARKPFDHVTIAETAAEARAGGGALSGNHTAFAKALAARWVDGAWLPDTVLTRRHGGALQQIHCEAESYSAAIRGNGVTRIMCKATPSGT